MFRFSVTLRLAAGLAFLGVSIFLASRTIGLGEDEWIVATRGRADLSEAIALHASSAISLGGIHRLKHDVETLVKRNPDLLSVGLRQDGQLVLQAGPHEEHWIIGNQDFDNGQIYVPIIVREKTWGKMELRFRPLRAHTLAGFLRSRAVAQLAFVLAAATLAFAVYLKKMLNDLDPSNVIPERVRAALDTFAEGLLVVDRNCCIVLANKAFAKTVGRDNDQLRGTHVDELPWAPNAESDLPWTEALSDGTARIGCMVDLWVTDHQRITFMVNASPIHSDKGELQGILASFDDVTIHEQRKKELEQTLRVLGESREQIRRQNAELRILATRDPLTGCLNRRAFFEVTEKMWHRCQSNPTDLACIMVDIDHFKSINDTHGHSVGDLVLESVGRSLVRLETHNATACRFGGEEFCITIEGYDEDAARVFAEEIRSSIAASRPGDIDITVSVGVALAGQSRGEEFHDVLERADKCLYVAKRGGRNRVICFHNIDPQELAQQEPEEGDGVISRPGIPFHAVTALISALTYRDAATAEHSRRVADLCVAVSSSMMSIRDQFILETAALLHDIGKIGTPDSVLLKPGPLDPEEREVMSYHDMMGIEIVKTTFDEPALLETVASHFAWFGGHPSLTDLPVGKQIPLGARILAICDTYDAIVTDRVYRQGASQEEAFAELRRCAGQQFDPDLVEEFIAVLSQNADQPLPQDHDGSVSKQVALQIGVLTEQMTKALELGDTAEVREQARQLSQAATESKLAEIALLADEMQSLAGGDGEFEALLEIAKTLLDLCRMTQRAYINVSEESRRRREAMAKRQFKLD